MRKSAFLTALSLVLLGTTAFAQSPVIVTKTQTSASPAKLTPVSIDLLKQQQMIKLRVEQNVVLGNKHMSARNYVAAEKTFRQVLQDDPSNSMAHAGLSMAQAKQFKLDAAEDNALLAISSDTNNALAHAALALATMEKIQSSNLSTVHQQDKFLQDAESEANKAVALNPNLPEAHFVLGSVLKERGQFDQALVQFENAAAIDPKYSEALSGAGNVKLLKGDLAGAKDLFMKAIAANSANSGAHFGLGAALVKEGDPARALDELNISVYQFPNSAPAHFMMGEAYRAQGNTEAAIKEYQESIRIKPENPGSYLHIAELREARGDLEHAVAELHSARESLPNDLQVREKLGELSLKLEKADDAIREYKAVFVAHPESPTARTGLTRAYHLKAQKELSKAFFSSNSYEDSQKALSEAITLSPNDMELRLAQTKLRKMGGELFDANKIGPPQNDGDMLNYAEALITKGQYKAARETVANLIGKTNDGKQLLAIGDTLQLTHDLTGAEQAYRKGLQYPGTTERAERGIVQVAKIRDDQRKDLALGSDLANRKQYESALDKFYDAVKKDPLDPTARLGLAKVLERLDRPDSHELSESVKQWHEYVQLESALPESERQQIQRHVERLSSKLAKLQDRERTALEAAKERTEKM